MKLDFATVPPVTPGPAAGELNSFLANHRVVGVETRRHGDRPSTHDPSSRLLSLLELQHRWGDALIS